MMKIPNRKRSTFVLKSNPLKLGIDNFFELLYFGGLLQVDFVFGDELETIWKSLYEIEDISIFAWSSFLGIEHYHWVCNSIRFVNYLSTTRWII
jgi:hypothetical protein